MLRVSRKESNKKKKKSQCFTGCGKPCGYIPARDLNILQTVLCPPVLICPNLRVTIRLPLQPRSFEGVFAWDNFYQKFTPRLRLHVYSNMSIIRSYSTIKKNHSIISPDRFSKFFSILIFLFLSPHVKRCTFSQNSVPSLLIDLRGARRERVGEGERKEKKKHSPVKEEEKKMARMTRGLGQAPLGPQPTINHLPVYLPAQTFSLNFTFFFL